ncbi:MAG: hypothetical protein ACPG73_07730 [Candidatus Poseidoniaceae archaeon]
MGLDLVAVLRRLGVSIDSGSPPVTEPGVITWLGRVYDVSPEQYNLGLSEGMELWTTGQGFAPLDRAGVESWLFDAPRGSHLIIAERKVNFDLIDLPSRAGRLLKLWQLDDFAAFIGHAVIDGRLSIIEEEPEDIEEDEIDMFAGPGPFVLKPMNDFSSLESRGLDITMAKPVLVPARLHKVIGLLKGPEIEEIESWVLNCGGFHILESVEILERPPMLHQETLEIVENPDYSEILSQRRPHSEGMGDLLHWWKFDSKSQKIETFDVFIPAHKGQDINGDYWIFDGVSSTLHLNR